MAIYHLNVKTGSRSKGQSAHAKSDYITRSGKYDRDPDEVMFSQSGNMPGWVDQPGDYWKAADTYERKNGTLYREIEFSLPVEFSPDQQRELATGFAEMLTRDQQLPFTFAIHRGKGHNPHCHLMISEKIGDGIDRSPQLWFKRHNSKNPEKGGAKKADISSRRKKWLEDTRRGWADLANFALERAGFDERIDHRSLADQGIDRVPQIHIGQNAIALERKGIITDRGQEFMEIQEVNEEYERLKRAEREQAERETNTEVEPPGERFTGVEPRVGRAQQKPRTEARDMAEPGRSIWSRISGWLADRLQSKSPRAAKVATTKPDHLMESKELTMLKKRIRMAPEQRAAEDVKNRMNKYKEEDIKKREQYESDVNIINKSPSIRNDLKL